MDNGTAVGTALLGLGVGLLIGYFVFKSAALAGYDPLVPPPLCVDVTSY